MKEHPSLKKEKKRTVQVLEPNPPELIEITRQTHELTQKITTLKHVRETLYEELAKKAQEVYAPQINKLYEQVEQLFVTNQELKQLEVEVLQELKRVLAKY